MGVEGRKGKAPDNAVRGITEGVSALLITGSSAPGGKVAGKSF